MSGRFPKCPNPECRRFLFKRLNNVFSCGGCKQTFQAEDLIKLEQKANQVQTVSEEECLQPSISSPSYTTENQMYPNLLKRLNKPNPNYDRKDLIGSYSSASSVSSEETTIGREQNGRIDESFVPINRRLNGNYEGSVSSSSLSSDESGSTISRNLRAMSRRTHRREASKDSNLRYGSNLEEDEIKPVLYETIFPPNEPKMNLNPNKRELCYNTGSVRSSVISNEEIGEREYERFGFSSGRNLNPSFERRDISKQPLNSRNDEHSYKYYPNAEEEEEEEEEEETKTVLYEPNYSLNRSKIAPKPTKRDLRENTSSVRSSIISEEEIEEREQDNRNFAYSRGRRNSNASFDGSVSSRSFSSDEGSNIGTRISSGDSRFKSKRTYRSDASVDERTSNAPHSSRELNPIKKPSLQDHQNELNDVVNELAKFGVTREKLIMLLLKQTDDNESRNKRTLMRKLSFTVMPSSVETPRSTELGTSNSGRRKPAKHRCRPVLGGTPFVICSGCYMLLHLPIGLSKKELIKIRCGNCHDVYTYRFPAKNGPYIPLHKEMGYESARFLMAPSRQFSLMDDDNMSVIM